MAEAVRVAYDAVGRAYHLAPTGKEGGEGAIYTIDGRAKLCAKLFHANRLSEELHQKITVMVANPPDDPMQPRHFSIAWPQNLLYADSARQQFIGYTMPYLEQSFQEAHLYYDKSDRTKSFAGTFTWEHLLCAAWNLSSAVAALHDKGHCIGDLREKNILVAPDSLITLIDCDSFQVLDNNTGTVFHSRVGNPEYLPRELQNTSFADQDHDRYYADLFALGVLVFRFLMQGFHPYQSRGSAVVDAASTADKIQLGLYPYEHGALEEYSGRLLPPAYAPPYDAIPKAVRDLFKRCFFDGHGMARKRPTAREWYDALGNESSHCQRCSNNEDHIYSDELDTCPWCAFVAEGMEDPFSESKPPPAPAPNIGQQRKMRRATAAPPPPTPVLEREHTVVLLAWGQRVANFLWLYIIVAMIAAVFLRKLHWVPIMGIGFFLNLVLAMFGMGKRFGVYALLCIALPLMTGLMFNQVKPDKGGLSDAELKAKQTAITRAHKEKLEREKREAKTRISVAPTISNYVSHCDRIMILMVEEKRKLMKLPGTRDNHRVRTKNIELTGLQEDVRRMEPQIAPLFHQAFAELQVRMGAPQLNGEDPGNFTRLRARYSEMQRASFYLLEFYGKQFDELLANRSMRHTQVQSQLTAIDLLSASAGTFFVEEYSTLRQTRDTLLATRGDEDPEIDHIEDRMTLLAEMAGKSLRFHNDPRFIDLVPPGTAIWSKNVSTRTSLDVREVNGWPVIRGTQIFAPSQADKKIRAFSTLNGGPFWDLDLETDKDDLLPTCHSNHLFIHHPRRLYKIAMGAGEQSWPLPYPVGGRSTRLGFAGDMLFVGEDGSRLNIVSIADRDTVQSFQLEHEVKDICVNAEQTRAFVTTGRDIIAYELRPIPREAWRQTIITSSVVERGTVYSNSMNAGNGYLVFATADKEARGDKETRLFCVSSADGSEIWSNRGMKSMSPTVYRTPAGIVFALGKTVKLIDLPTGREIWQNSFDSSPFDIRTVDNLLFVLTNNLHVLRLDDGSEQWILTAKDLVLPSTFSSMIHPGDIVTSRTPASYFPRKGGVQAMRRKILLEAGGNKLFGSLCSPPMVDNRVFFYGKNEVLYCVWAGPTFGPATNAQLAPAPFVPQR
ncbi:MAG: serine/threonine protein kinase/outer membrane protein assembly factor BamB [Rhodothermales bacterium]|jgi:serine/threonine protein kinase/outer membrane protein assembly factor BamB